MTSMAPTDAGFRTLYYGFGFENVDGVAAGTSSWTGRSTT